MNSPNSSWSEQDSQTFIKRAQYYVPERTRQIQAIASLIPATSEPSHIMELCSGDGSLAEAILARHQACHLHAYDGSDRMRRQARQRLERFGDRFEVQPFALASDDWRQPPWPVHAVVSSLCIHHLSSKEKQKLFRDIFTLLKPGGVFIIADLVQPTTPEGNQLAAREWDDAVRRNSLAIDGSEALLEQFHTDQWNHYRHPDPSDQPSPLLYQLQWLEDAGFKKVDVYWMLAGHAIFGGVKLAPPSPAP